MSSSRIFSDAQLDRLISEATQPAPESETPETKTQQGQPGLPASFVVAVQRYLKTIEKRILDTGSANAKAKYKYGLALLDHMMNSTLESLEERLDGAKDDVAFPQNLTHADADAVTTALKKLQATHAPTDASPRYNPPSNWDKGWFYPWKIAAGGYEIPYLEGGRWKLRIFHAKERQYYTYDFSTDTLEPETK